MAGAAAAPQALAQVAAEVRGAQQLPNPAMNTIAFECSLRRYRQGDHRVSAVVGARWNPRPEWHTQASVGSKTARRSCLRPQSECRSRPLTPVKHPTQRCGLHPLWILVTDPISAGSRQRDRVQCGHPTIGPPSKHIGSGAGDEGESALDVRHRCEETVRAGNTRT